MAYKILKQFQPGPAKIWVEKLTHDDPIYIFDNLAEAEAKKNELTAADPTDRIYKVVEV